NKKSIGELVERCDFSILHFVFTSKFGFHGFYSAFVSPFVNTEYNNPVTAVDISGNSSLPFRPVLSESCKNLFKNRVSPYILTTARKTFHLVPCYIFRKNASNSFMVMGSKKRIHSFYRFNISCWLFECFHSVGRNRVIVPFVNTASSRCPIICRSSVIRCICR